MEFELDLPYIADEEEIQTIMNGKKCQHHEATRMDYHLNWREKRRSFRLETRCITAMYERLFSPMKTEDSRKILVECVDHITDARVLNISGVVSVQVEFSHDEFRTANEDEKKRIALHLLMKGIGKAAGDRGWLFEPFRTVATQIEQTGYSNEWVWKQAVPNRVTKYYAEVLCQHHVNSMDISILIRTANGVEVHRELVRSELPDEFAYAKHLGELKWISASEVALINKKGDNRVSVKVEVNHAKEIF